MTVPLDGVSLGDQRAWLGELEALGYTDLWSSEAASADAFTPLALAAEHTERARLGAAIAPVFTRGPATLAISAASLAELAPGRFVLGLGASSPVIVEDWNAQAYQRPLARVRDTVRFLRRALAGERVTEQYDTFSVRRFRLDRVPREPVPIMVAALRPMMLDLAAAEADGAIAVFLSAGDAKRVSSRLDGKELIARILVFPEDDVTTLRQYARPHLAAYLCAPAYAAYHRWLGRAEALDDMWRAWDAGDRSAAARAVPDAVIDELIVWGSASDCKAKIRDYVDNGVTCPVIAVQPWGVDGQLAARDLAP